MSHLAVLDMREYEGVQSEGCHSGANAPHPSSRDRGRDDGDDDGVIKRPLPGMGHKQE